jgi:ferredoxin-NADP reductase
MVDGSINVKVTARDEIARGVVRLTLTSATDERLPIWHPGAHIDVILSGDVVRQYSLCGDPSRTDKYEIAVLKDPNGRGGSIQMCRDIGVGCALNIRAPRQLFPLLAAKNYIFVAGGIGITPLLPMIAVTEAVGSNWRLLYGGRERASMAFRDVLAHYGDRVTVAPQDESGLLDLDSWLSDVIPETLIYACGPEALLQAIERKTVHWPRGSLHVERFAPKTLDEPLLDVPFEVELRQSGFTLQVPVGRSILDVVTDAGIPALSSCGLGTCGTCWTAVLEGVPDHRDSLLDEAQRQAGDQMLICVSRSRSHKLVLDL